MGGLSKRAAQINDHTESKNIPALIVDSGNLLFRTPSLLPKKTDAAEVTAEGIIQSYLAMNAKIINVGGRDLAAGIDFLRQSHQTDGLVWLSANILDKTLQQPLFRPYTIREVAGVNIAVIGLTDHIQVGSRAGDYILRPGLEILPNLVGELESGADMIVLLSSYPLRINRAIAEAYSNIHLILQSGHSSGNLAPTLVNNTLICQTASRGKYLGILAVQWQASGRWQLDPLEQTAELNRQITRLEAGIRRRKNHLEPNQFGEDQELKRLLAAKDSLLDRRKALQEDAAENGRKDSVYSNRFIALKPSMAGDPVVKAIVSQTKRKRTEQGKQNRAKSAPQR